ncbi:MAG: hypothetical protein KKB50_14520 [Planctomycetes bacterium]|nr:hypothetical protein [Planctomycetota bacterium]
MNSRSNLPQWLVCACAVGLITALFAPSPTFADRAPTVVWKNGGSPGVFSVAYWGDMLVTAEDDVKIWSRSGDAINQTISASSALCVAVSPFGGQYIAAGGGDDYTGGWVTVWRTSDWTPVYYMSYAYQVWGLAFSPDGSKLALGTARQQSGKYNPRICVLSVPDFLQAGQIIWSDVEGSIESIAFCPDNQSLVASASEGTIRRYDISSWPALPVWSSMHDPGVYSVAISSDEQTVASAGWDGTIRIWNAGDGSYIRTLTGHEDMVWSVAFSPTDPNLLASGSWDTAVKLWDVANGSVVQTLSGHAAHVFGVAFSNDGEELASGAAACDAVLCWGEVMLWEVDTGGNLADLAQGHSNEVRGLAFSRDSARLASASPDNTVKLWDAETGNALETLLIYTDVYSVAISPDGHYLACDSLDWVEFWDIWSYTRIGDMRSHTEQVNAVAFSEDGQYVASVSDDGNVIITAVPALIVDQVLDLHTPWEVKAVAFSPDGQLMVTGDNGYQSQYGRIILWNTSDWSYSDTLDGHTGGVSCLAVSPTGQVLASGSTDTTIKLWSLPAGDELRTLAGHTTGVVALAFSADGAALASVDAWGGTLRIWRTVDGTLLDTYNLEPHGGAYAVACSADKRFLSYGCSDTTLIVAENPFPPPKGDLNCDGVVDGFDIEHFIQALDDPNGYVADHDGDPYPLCDLQLADTNGDGRVNGFDIDSFVALLEG